MDLAQAGKKRKKVTATLGQEPHQIASYRNHYGQRVITREADLVTAHEFGHNWGSEHDPDIPECSPSASQGGSYLMYTYSVSGYDVNNKKFSPCSLRFIRKVMEIKYIRLNPIPVGLL